MVSSVSSQRSDEGVPSSTRGAAGSRRLRPKDWISIGVYAVVYIVVMYAVAMVGFIPVLMPLTGVFIGILCQIPILMMVVKVPGHGVFTVLGILVGLLAGLGAWPTLVSAVIAGILADCVLWMGRSSRRRAMVIAAAVFNMWSYGKYYPSIPGPPCSTF